MRRRTWIGTLLVALLLSLIAGCSSSGERSINKNKDRPTANK